MLWSLPVYSAPKRTKQINYYRFDETQRSVRSITSSAHHDWSSGHVITSQQGQPYEPQRLANGADCCANSGETEKLHSGLTGWTPFWATEHSVLDSSSALSCISCSGKGKQMKTMRSLQVSPACKIQRKHKEEPGTSAGSNTIRLLLKYQSVL